MMTRPKPVIDCRNAAENMQRIGSRCEANSATEK